ncbi:MAG: alpha/beta hydrolase [Chitinophagales bacterium]|nr:alpha/beta hydrolase [Chitinophagales bacterium]MDW8418090.1 alpha/beta hydrolase [Chitinophagales bacterium]
MVYPVIKENGFSFCEQGKGTPVMLLHGLFGALSNFNHIISHFSHSYLVSVPLLPLFDLEPEDTNITGMLDYVDAFVEYRQYNKVNIVGNSLGGHIALMYALRRPDRVRTITLTGSSGLFENSLGDTYPRKGDYEYVKKKTEATFYDPKHATQELIQEVYDIVNNRQKALRIVLLAKSAIRHNLREQIPEINMPVCLIWGKNDTITPAYVGEEFHKLLAMSELHLLDGCGHAPMMEHPEKFNNILEQFLKKHNP